MPPSPLRAEPLLSTQLFSSTAGSALSPRNDWPLRIVLDAPVMPTAAMLTPFVALLLARGAFAWQAEIGPAPSHASRRHAAPHLDLRVIERTLSPATSWRLQLELGKPESSEKVSVTATVRFREEDGYEPPQGFLRVDSCLPEGVLQLGEAPVRWQLSEDPEDRKVWGGRMGSALRPASHAAQSRAGKQSWPGLGRQCAVARALTQPQRNCASVWKGLDPGGG
jgi:hypothetical protein